MGDDMPIDMDHWTAKEGLTCLSCHAIEGLRDVKGNGRYVISAPDEYPFARHYPELGNAQHLRQIAAPLETEVADRYCRWLCHQYSGAASCSRYSCTAAMRRAAPARR